jgi:hypothetical protein
MHTTSVQVDFADPEMAAAQRAAVWSALAGQLLLENVPSPGSALDVGCGTGFLSSSWRMARARRRRDRHLEPRWSAAEGEVVESPTSILDGMLSLPFPDSTST